MRNRPIIAIDPGPERSAWVQYNGTLTAFGLEANDMVLVRLESFAYLPEWCSDCIVEMVACYGMPVGKEVFETCVWIGRFMQILRRNRAVPTHRLYRRDVKLHLCGSVRAKDANVRQALIDRFGPGKEKAIGRKKTPGPLYGVTKDVWAALGVAVTWWDKNVVWEDDK